MPQELKKSAMESTFAEATRACTTDMLTKLLAHINKDSLNLQVFFFSLSNIHLQLRACVSGCSPEPPKAAIRAFGVVSVVGAGAGCEALATVTATGGG